MGVCSYGLIGFYYQDQRKYWIGGPAPTAFVTPSQASLKALVVTGLGDMLMLGGILLLYFYAGTLNFLELYATAPTWLAMMAASPGMVILVSLLLLAGPLGEIGPVPLPGMAPRGDGRTSPGLGPHPRRDHGQERRLSDRPPGAAVLLWPLGRRDRGRRVVFSRDRLGRRLHGVPSRDLRLWSRWNSRRS